MEFKEVVKKLSIESYPAELEEMFNNGGVSNFDSKDIDALDEEYHAVGNLRESLKLCLEEVKKDEALWGYTYAAAALLSKVTHTGGYEIKLPEVKSEYPLCHYLSLLLVMAMPAAVAKYHERGFYKEEIVDILGAFRGRINSLETGLNPQGYHWLRHYTSSVLYKTSLFSITPRILVAPMMLLKNTRHEYKLIATGGRYHRDGKVLGSAGYTDEDGAFDAEFSEDELCYTGNEVINACVTKNAIKLKKSEWSVVIKQGDGIAGIHIPRGADLSDEKMKKSFREAFEIMKERYPDYNPKAVHCSSWLVCPTLIELQGPNSNITRFVNTFIKYPIKSAGTELFGFAFPKKPDSYEELAEDTSLQRKIKALYLDGKHIHAHAGFVPEEYFM